MFSNGIGVKVDNKRAVFYYLKAAELGFSGSQNNLGWAYYKGTGVSKNFGLAIYWITRATEQGEPFAYGSLGEMRFYAHGFPADDVEAYRWLKLADNGLPPGTSKDQNSKLLKRLETRMSADKLAKAVSLVEAWKPLKQTDKLMGNKCKST